MIRCQKISWENSRGLLYKFGVPPEGDDILDCPDLVNMPGFVLSCGLETLSSPCVPYYLMGNMMEYGYP